MAHGPTLIALITVNAAAIIIVVISIVAVLKDKSWLKIVSKYFHLCSEQFHYSIFFFQHSCAYLMVAIVTIGLVAAIGSIEKEMTSTDLVSHEKAYNFISKYQDAYFGVGATLICLQVS